MANEALIGYINKLLAIYKEVDSLISGLSYLLTRREAVLSESSKDASKKTKSKAEGSAGDESIGAGASEIEVVNREIKESYRRIVDKKQEMHEHIDDLPEVCRSPLVLYFVREFLKEGLCDTIAGGVKLYSNKYQSLVNSKDEKEIALLRQINIELAKAGQRDSFLATVDEKVKNTF